MHFNHRAYKGCIKSDTLITTYNKHTYFNCTKCLCCRLYCDFNDSVKNAKKLSRLVLLISYRRSKNLRDILVRAKHRKPPSKPPDVFRCNRSRCKTCPFIKEGTTSYTFFSTNEERQIRHHITCSSSNLVYMIQCNKCRTQYIGETKQLASDRFGEHRRAVEKAIQKQPLDQPTAVSDHFAIAGHSLNNLEFIPLELTQRQHS